MWQRQNVRALSANAHSLPRTIAFRRRNIVYSQFDALSIRRFFFFSKLSLQEVKQTNRRASSILYAPHIIETWWLCVLRAWFHILGVGNFFSSSPSVYSQNQICVFHIFVVYSHCVIYNVWCVLRVCVMYIYATVQPNKSWETTKHIHTEIFGWLWQLTMCVRFINSDCLHGILPVKCIHNPIV